MGSAKDVVTNLEPTLDFFGEAEFHFKDDYSVDDLVSGYGIKMADQIEGKGVDLWRMTNYNFQNLATMLSTHYLGSLRPGVMLVHKANVFKAHVPREEIIEGPKINIDFVYNIPKEATNFVIPLEVIGRNELGQDSSIMRMYKKGEIIPQDIGLEQIPEDGKLPHPITTYTTKYESGDKFLTRDQAMVISGLTDKQFELMERLDRKVHNALDRHTKKVAERYDIDLRRPDGKREWIWYEDYPMLSDCFGTFDEDRFEIHLEDESILKLSKQPLRDWMRSTEWYQKEFLPWKGIVDKSIEEDVKKEKWPEISPAPSIPNELLTYVENVYDTGSKMWTLLAEQEEVNKLIEDFQNLREESIIR